MADKDTITKDYMSDAEHFADAFNFLLYDGEERIKPERLHEMDTSAIAVPFGSDNATAPVQKYRDVLKMLTVMQDDKRAYLILGIENQTEIHFAMPARDMLYDSIQYNAQIERAKKTHRQDKDGKPSPAEWLSGWYKTDSLIPVITLVIYFGEDEWNAPKSLHEMFGYTDEIIQRFVPDYKINLIAPNQISDEEFDKFHTGLREVLKFIKYAKDKKKLQEILTEDDAFRHVDRKTADTINIITKSNLKFTSGEECVDMCKAISDIRTDARVEDLVNIMQSLNLTFEQAFSAMKLPAEMEEEYRAMADEAITANK